MRVCRGCGRVEWLTPDFAAIPVGECAGTKLVRAGEDLNPSASKRP